MTDGQNQIVLFNQIIIIIDLEKLAFGLGFSLWKNDIFTQ